MLSGELFEDDAQLDGYFETESCKSREFYEREVTLHWQHSKRGRHMIQINRYFPAIAEEADERFTKLKRDFVISHEIKGDIQNKLIKLVSALKKVTLRIS